MSDRVMTPGQTVAFVMANKHAKLEDCSSYSIEAMAKVKVSHVATDDDDGVETNIDFFERTAELKTIKKYTALVNLTDTHC